MRSLALTAIGVFALLTVLCGAASAQVPFIATYFDAAYTQETSPNPCPGVGTPGNLWISLNNANAFVTGVEFAVSYPPEMVWMADQDTQPVTVGNTPGGFSMGWALPQNGFYRIPVCKVVFLWNCDYCTRTNIPIVVVPHPITGTLGYTDYPMYTLHQAVGLTSLICQTIPVEETTWGQVKSLYSE